MNVSVVGHVPYERLGAQTPVSRQSAAVEVSFPNRLGGALGVGLWCIVPAVVILVVARYRC
ncbi:hypothetical protein [Nocardia sp. NPDC057455]|uniref:hypothetical protein n=1 Tax=Nocardia sp. NPDC057455 TaxID=3346138 RepID=UPI0036702FDC